MNPVDEIASLSELVRDMNSGAVDTLLILGGNPVYDAPADLGFLDALKKIRFRAHLGLYADETAEWCYWQLCRRRTYLEESWSDAARAYDGTASIVQPLIAPLYGGKTAHEVINVLLNLGDEHPLDTVRGYWQSQHKGADFDDFWQVSLHDGVIAGTAFAEKTPPSPKVPWSQPPSHPALRLCFVQIPPSGIGRFPTTPGFRKCRSRRAK